MVQIKMHENMYIANSLQKILLRQFYNFIFWYISFLSILQNENGQFLL